MFLFYMSDALAIIGILLVYASPVIIIGLIIYFFVKGREKPASIFDGKNSGDK